MHVTLVGVRDDWVENDSDSRELGGQGLPPRVYATFFDSSYAARGLVLIDSLRQVGDSSPIMIVCFDDDARAAVLALADSAVTALDVAELERRFPELAAVRTQRTRAEYFFTCTPYVTLLAAELVAVDGWAVYLDADMWFAGSTAALYAELDAPATGQPADVGIVAHEFRADRPSLNRFGRFNVGWVSFRNNERGLAVLRWWAEQCLRRCRDEPADGLFADQGYLDSFPDFGPHVRQISHPGVGVGPWNLHARRFTLTADGDVRCNDADLICYHFHGLRHIGRRYVAMHVAFGNRADAVVQKHVYAPYVAALSSADQSLARRPPARRGRGTRGAAARARRGWYYLLALARGESWPISPARAPRLADPMGSPERRSTSATSSQSR